MACGDQLIFPMKMNVEEALELHKQMTNRLGSFNRPTSRYKTPTPEEIANARIYYDSGRNPCGEVPIDLKNHELPKPYVEVDLTLSCKGGFTRPTRPAVPQPVILGHPPEKSMHEIRLEEVETLYTKRMIITTRHKVETELKYFFNELRKDKYMPPYLYGNEEREICRRINDALTFLLKLAQKIDIIQQDNEWGDTHHIEILMDLQ